MQLPVPSVLLICGPAPLGCLSLSWILFFLGKEGQLRAVESVKTPTPGLIPLLLLPQASSPNGTNLGTLTP